MKHAPALIFALAAFTIGCDADDPDKTAADGAGSGADGADGGDTSTPLDAPTWHGDVQPMLATHCTRCHHEGGLGPGDFTDPATATALADAMLAAIDDGRMPPAASEPSCRDYVGSDVLTLPSEARDLLAEWIAADKPEGTATDATPTLEVSDQLKDPDLVLTMPEPYAPTYSDERNPGNEYRCFALDPAEAGGKFITAMAPTIDAASIVHHAVLFTVPKDELGSEFLDPQGFDCIDGEGGSATDGMLAAWAPGMLPIEFPEGAGMQVPDDAYLVLQMHYFANGGTEGAADQSGYAFKLADTVDTRVMMAPVGDYSFRIPPGEANHSDGGTFRNTYFDLDVLGIFPHMHKLGTRFDAVIAHEDGSETCLVAGDYDFDNQMTYMFKEPAVFAEGDEVRFTCTWDNSAGTDTVRYGERTDEEMCFFFTLVAF
jgi:hypothetical protein